MNSNELRRHMTQKHSELTNRVFCTHGQHYVDPAGGKWKPTANRLRRFICVSCQRVATEKRKEATK